MYYCEPTALIETLIHKRIVFHNFTIRDISVNSHENDTVNSWWCRVNILQIPSSGMQKDFAAEIQGRT
jgi:hypothetical protein